MPVFAQAMQAVFRDPNIAADAFYLAGGHLPGIPVRVIRQAPDRIADWNGGRFVSDSVRIDILSEEVTPETGDRVLISGAEYELISDAVLDSENLIWKAEARKL